MSRKLEKEIDKLEKAAEEKHAREFAEICARYGNKAEELVKHGSEYEKNFVLEYLWPQGVEDFMALFEVFGPTVFEVAFERFIYPAVLSDEPAEENENVILAIDEAFMRLVYPILWKEFLAELKTLKPGSKISDELKEKFDKVRKEREELKNSIRAKLRREEIEDQKLLQQERGD